MDIRTLFVMTVINGLVLGVAQIIVWQRHRDGRALLFWGMANFAGAAGSLLIAMRGQIPPIFSVAIGNGLIIIWLTLLWAGTRHFDGRRVPPAAVFGLPLATTVVMLIPWVADNLAIRTMLVSGLNALLLSVVTLDLRQAQRAEPLAIRRFLIVVFIVAAAPCYARIVLSTDLAPQGDFMQSGAAQAAMLMHMNLFILAWNVGGLLMFNERMQNTLSHAARTDVVTGLDNGTSFAERAERRLQHAVLAERPISLLMISPRHLTGYNPYLRNAATDKAMRLLARALCVDPRPGDLLAYLGGEQFALLAMDCDADSAAVRAEHLIGRIHEQALTHPGTPRGRIQLLVGFSSGQAADFASIRELSDLANAALQQLRHTPDQSLASFDLPPDGYTPSALQTQGNQAITSSV